jgi:hypothetical protein
MREMKNAYKFLIGKPNWNRLGELGADANGFHKGARNF